MPGKTPHPIREENGHSFGRPEPHVEHFDPNKWTDCSAFLFGVDLFNAGFYWESHEQWEAIWHAVGRTGVLGDFLKGLIKLSAAGVKLLEGRPVGVQRHLQRAIALFSTVSEQHDSLCGLVMQDLVRVANEAGDELQGRGESASPAAVQNDTPDAAAAPDGQVIGLPITLPLRRSKPS